MKKRLLIVANNADWKSWPEKIEELKKWFAPKVELDVSLVHTNFNYIPWEVYDHNTGAMGVAKIWYQVFVASLAKKEDDLVLFVVNKSQWQPTKARGWRGGIKNGAVALQLGANEFEPFWKRLLGLDGEMFHQVARHEIMHGLFYLKCGKNVRWDLPPQDGQCIDTTHHWWDLGQLENALIDLVPEVTKPQPVLPTIYILHHTATPRDKTNLDAIIRDHNKRYGRSFYQCFITADGNIHWQHKIENQRNKAMSVDYCVVGDFTKEDPTDKQLEALDELTKGLDIIGHGEATKYGATASECPGTLLEDLADLRKRKELLGVKIGLLKQIIDLLKLRK